MRISGVRALAGRQAIPEAAPIRDDKQEEGRAHRERTIDAARALFPEYFDGERYRWKDALEGAPYYIHVLETNRGRLKELGRDSRLNLYLTTTFAYEEMVVLLYAAVAQAVSRSTLPAAMRQRIGALIARMALYATPEAHRARIEAAAAATG